MALFRPFLGNPYKAPGTIHARVEKYKNQQKNKKIILNLEDEGFIESFMNQKALDDSIS
eukprot:CAMPEP_0170568386 /NCGR_PEP_ID=MMETSP0211-20121228/81158_1 /TAXON_ID=311385 /ORGANISM="Pseudokeronopsis sp., Strain OXSARD2" /LENGTH=58 /DNA_ID=CAMNT_0010890245 /DNA_START=667 /DNA_END=843 /DNA_ORIENTATION=+